MAVKQYRILVVDDEVRILNFLKSKLKAAGYEIVTAGNGREALEQVHAKEPDLVVLDVLMPTMGGFEMLKELRTFSKVPVIILSAKGADIDKIKGLGLGADDYLPKPFNPDELVARIKAVMRRLKATPASTAQEQISIGDIHIDFKSHHVVVKNEEINLTRIEWLLISELAQNIGRLMPYEELLTRVWGPEYRSDVQLLRTWVSRLRNKLEENPGSPSIISTIPKVGYIINLPLS
jgi:two-component system, OmpR family, KDP operon response regulator KdpE